MKVMNEILTDGIGFLLPCKECAGASGAQWLGWSCTFLFGRGWLNVICGFCMAETLVNERRE